MAEAEVAVSSPELDLEGIDLDVLLNEFGDPKLLDFDSFLSDTVGDSPEPVSASPSLGLSDQSSNCFSSSPSSWTEKLEQFLLGDDGEGEMGNGESEGNGEGFGHGFFADVFGWSSDSGEEGNVKDAGNEEEKQNEELKFGLDSGEIGNCRSKMAATENGEEEEEDASSKKRRRQLRNRDSAMKSRERKKMYLKELEVKNRYLESECRRLDHALQCSVAENMALRHHLQKERVPGALGAKQESAVLVMESLLLGSLFWLISIVSLFLVPGLCSLNLMDKSRLGNGHAQEILKMSRPTSKSYDPGVHLGSVFMRRFRGMRTKMKICLLLPLHAFP